MLGYGTKSEIPRAVKDRCLWPIQYTGNPDLIHKNSQTKWFLKQPVRKEVGCLYLFSLLLQDITSFCAMTERGDAQVKF